jgi:hypothetical protein
MTRYICFILLAVLFVTGCHFAWQDETHTQYNGYTIGGVYRLLKPMQLAHFNSSDIGGQYVPSNYYIDSGMSPGPHLDGDLPVGTRIRFEKTVWAPSHEGPGCPVAYGVILDPPFASKLVNLIDVSDKNAVEQIARPDTNILAIVSN